ncbi:MAG: HAD hydrolase-like protein, partial [Clostridia bacterium]|nr:HAD hydrolase-like protein [Clostridia bacterium]
MDKSQRFANILFDLDGTLTDPALGITSSVQYALRKMGIEVEDITTLNWMIGPPLLTSFKEGYGMSDDDAKRALGFYREYFSVTGIYQNEIYPGIKEMLEKLYNQGYTIAMATSKPILFAEKILEYFDIKKFFHVLAGASMDETRNTKDAVLKYALTKLQAMDRV